MIVTVHTKLNKRGIVELQAFYGHLLGVYWVLQGRNDGLSVTACVTVTEQMDGM